MLFKLKRCLFTCAVGKPLLNYMKVYFLCMWFSDIYTITLKHCHTILLTYSTVHWHVYLQYIKIAKKWFTKSILSGRRDSSGIRLWHTRSLRRFDAGIMELGLVYTPVMAIPPHQDFFQLSGYCTAKCTRTVRTFALGIRTNIPKYWLQWITNETHLTCANVRPFTADLWWNTDII